MSRQLSLMKDWFEAGLESGWIGIYECELLRFLEREYGAISDEIRMCVVFLSLFIKAGHTCLPVNKSPDQWVEILGLDVEGGIFFPGEKIDLPDSGSDKIIGSAGDIKPLTLSGSRLTFRRYWNYEFNVGQLVKKNISKYSTTDIDAISVQILNEFFPEDSDNINWQKVATALSLFKPFLIISGGPGTGKTTTVARIIALHQRLSETRLNIALAAPTGKAAGRMGEALNRELAKLDLSSEELRIFTGEAKTIHRLLSGTESRGLLPPVEKKKLRYDLIIIDEASMMDLSLMYRLVSHLGEKSKLILLGDKDQLASVEAGSVFSDLCQKTENRFLRGTIQKLHELGIPEPMPEERNSEIGDSIVYLTKSYRFDKESGIGQLSEFVKFQGGENRKTESVLEKYEELDYQTFDYKKEDIQRILEDLKRKIGSCVKIQDPQQLLSFWKESIWLMVLRKGLTGTERLNRLVEERLAAERMVNMNEGWYHGRPVIITQNDYNLGVFNGDLGVSLKVDDGSMWVYIETGSEIKRFKPQRLTHYDPAYFLTVHKSQGSEFDHVHFLLPQKDTPVLTKELLYTAITRARSRFSLYGSLKLFEIGMKRETTRYTGLKEILHDL